MTDCEVTGTLPKGLHRSMALQGGHRAVVLFTEEVMVPRVAMGKQAWGSSHILPAGGKSGGEAVLTDMET
jgi:hypothetical protein